MKRGEEKQTIKIRSCKEQDLEVIKEIEQKNFPTPWPMASFKQILHRDSGMFLVAATGNEVWAYSIANVERDINLSRFQTRREGHLLKIAVAQKKRRQGIGTSLIKVLENNLQEEGIESMKLEVRVQNKGARKFYKTRGFEEKELIKNYYPDGAHSIVMRKRIS